MDASMQEVANLIWSYIDVYLTSLWFPGSWSFAFLIITIYAIFLSRSSREYVCFRNVVREVAKAYAKEGELDKAEKELFAARNNVKLGQFGADLKGANSRYRHGFLYNSESKAINTSHSSQEYFQELFLLHLI